MTSHPGRGLLHLAAAVDLPGTHEVAAVDLPGTHDAAPYLPLARLAEHGVLDFVTLHDTFAVPGPESLAVLSRLAPHTSRVGLVPTVTTTHAGPCHVRAAVATLDRVSRGRAGWRPAVPACDDEAQLFGCGPAIAPRPPQGHPVVVIDATRPQACDVAARHADVALVAASGPARLGDVRDGLRRRAAELGRDPETLRVLAALRIDLSGGECAAQPGHGGGPLPTEDGPLYRGGPVDLADLIADWHRAGAADGFHLTPLDPRRDLERLVNGTVPLLQHRALFRTFYPGSTLREHLGLDRSVSRFAALAGESS
ncbi:LLM class flavin-dependent oxidoreductase [Streptomyces sp. NPDC049813]|uniref:LLM class flavin-dependent oxidoreductase n=1 Tax=Streptomyces sp. NPDC049813 TaxID=3365597 RepID=UPI0037BDC2F8